MSDKNDDVGYSRPPKRHRFKKGHSGNPKGRPRKEKNDAIDVLSVIEEPVTVSTGFTTKKMHPYEAGLRLKSGKALKGKSIRAVIDLVKLFEKYGLFKHPEITSGGGVIFAPKGITPQEWINEQNGLTPDDKHQNPNDEPPKQKGHRDVRNR